MFVFSFIESKTARDFDGVRHFQQIVWRSMKSGETYSRRRGRTETQISAPMDSIHESRYMVDEEKRIGDRLPGETIVGRWGLDDWRPSPFPPGESASILKVPESEPSGFLFLCPYLLQTCQFSSIRSPATSLTHTSHEHSPSSIRNVPYH